jgi:zinc/manganese transport system substrate-binding protein
MSSSDASSTPGVAGPAPSPPRRSRRTVLAVLVVVVLVIAGVGVYYAYLASTPPAACAGVNLGTASSSTSSTLPTDARPSPVVAPARSAPEGISADAAPYVLNVVAAENFWGSLVAQIGGNWTHVTSIITDPNTDPHEYESNDSDARAIAEAQYVIINNVGYDDWATQLVAADGASNQTILNVGDSLGVSVNGGIVSGNPHLWYNPTYVNETVAWMYHNLTEIEPQLTGYFSDNYANVTRSLATMYGEVGLIHKDFAGTEVASTESIFVYLANATGLDLVSPPPFMEAVAEGNDPPDSSVVTFQCQLESGHVKVLVFNAQTVTPTTTSMKEIAQANNVTVMSVTETLVPPSASFQGWMSGELNALYVSLDAGQLGQ